MNACNILAREFDDSLQEKRRLNFAACASTNLLTILQINTG